MTPGSSVPTSTTEASEAEAAAQPVADRRATGEAGLSAPPPGGSGAGEAVSVVTIDGPAGAGKSTVAREVARSLGFRYIDTGAMYRAVTWLALREGVDPEDGAALSSLARDTAIELDQGEDGGVRVRVEGVDVTAAIRSPEVERAVALVARHPAVRAAMVARQRRLALLGRAVLEGRDTGSHVVPEAGFKFYLTARPEVRARRRLRQLRARGHRVSLAQVLREVEDRDRLDAGREAAPLRPAPGAEVIDTSDLDARQVVGLILERMGRRVRPGPSARAGD